MEFKVIAASPFWGISGVNIFSVNLVRGLRERGISARILLSGLDDLDPHPMTLPLDVPVDKLAVPKKANWKTRWQATIDYLESQAPCIYIPNTDFQHSCVCPKLSTQVGIVGIMHSDDYLFYEHISRLGKYWNAIASVSKAITDKTVELEPALASRLVTISYGVSTAASLPQRNLDPKRPLKIVYAGRLVQYQKRILDLPQIADLLVQKQIPIELSILGVGKEQPQVMAASQHLVAQGAVKFLGNLPNAEVLQILAQNDVFILTSDFEGMPVSLLEAMGRGCIPVVTDINSGIPELIVDGLNGYRVPVGDIQLFAERLTEIYTNIETRAELSANAYRTITEGGYRTQDMVAKYLDLFEQVMQEVSSGTYFRPQGEIVPPPYLIVSWQQRIIPSIRFVGRYIKKVLLKLVSKTS
jgi:glycosyltransferase involved in cell wall biosynthesis